MFVVVPVVFVVTLILTVNIDDDGVLAEDGVVNCNVLDPEVVEPLLDDTGDEGVDFAVALPSKNCVVLPGRVLR